jgi:hypothetical protein
MDQDPQQRMAAVLTAARLHLGVPALFDALDEQPDDRCILLYLALLKRALLHRKQLKNGSSPTLPLVDARMSRVSITESSNAAKESGGPDEAPVPKQISAGDRLARIGADLSEEELRRLQARLMHGDRIETDTSPLVAPSFPERAPPPLPPELRDEAGPGWDGRLRVTEEDRPGAAGREQARSTVRMAEMHGLRRAFLGTRRPCT